MLEIEQDTHDTEEMPCVCMCAMDCGEVATFVNTYCHPKFQKDTRWQYLCVKCKESEERFDRECLTHDWQSTYQTIE